MDIRSINNKMGLIIISGASSGIGEFLFQSLSSTNENIILGLYNSTKRAGENYYKVDITDYKEVEAFINSISSLSSHLSLINCAGISYNSYAHKADIRKWKKVIEVNLIGTFNLIHLILPIMRKNNWGRIINFSSVVAKFPTPGVSAYAASKSALWGLTKSLCVENASKGITINNINLGYTEVGMGIKDVPEPFRSDIMKKIPAGRFCYKEEVINTVNYILKTPFLNGSGIDINGGLI